MLLLSPSERKWFILMYKTFLILDPDPQKKTNLSRPADKGGAVVVLPKDILEAIRQLENQAM